MQDPNGNRSEVVFDVLGMPTAIAVKGKGTEGDSLAMLTDDLLNLDTATRSNFFTSSFNEVEARRLLDQATARHIYYFGEEEVDGIYPLRSASPLCGGHLTGAACVRIWNRDRQVRCRWPLNTPMGVARYW